jgi:hypothetical protein
LRFQTNPGTKKVIEIPFIRKKLAVGTHEVIPATAGSSAWVKSKILSPKQPEQNTLELWLKL